LLRRLGGRAEGPPGHARGGGGHRVPGPRHQPRNAAAGARRPAPAAGRGAAGRGAVQLSRTGLESCPTTQQTPARLSPPGFLVVRRPMMKIESFSWLTVLFG